MRATLPVSGHLIDGTSLGPEALRTDIAGNFGDIPVEMDNARYQLALLSICNEDSRDVEVLKRAALLRLTLD